MPESTSQSLGPRATITLLLASLLPLIDSSLVNVLIPQIGRDLKVVESTVHLGVSSYILAAAAGIVLSTTCIRRFGTLPVWIASVMGFAASSILVGLSGTFAVFVLARVIQGVACGFIMPSVQQITTDIVGREGMRSALATIGLPAVLAPAVGPLLGGVLVAAVGWRVLFLINAPIGIIALLLACGTFPPHPGNREPLGLVQAAPGISGVIILLWTMSMAGTKQPTTIILMLVLAIVLILVFCLADLRSSTPVLDMSLYREIPFAITMLLCLITGAVFYGTLLSTSLHLQDGLGQPAYMAGVMLAIQGIGAWVSRKMIQGPWHGINAFLIIGIGLMLAAIGTLGIATVDAWRIATVTMIVLCCLLRGLGIGACTLLALSAAYEVVQDSQTPAVGAHTRLMLQIGGAFGTALIGTWSGTALGLGVLVSSFALIGTVAASGLWILQRRSINEHD